jgi:acyl-CoA dehydrogenase
MDFAVSAELEEIRAAVAEVCSGFPGEYWRALEPDGYPTEFVEALTRGGWLAALIPEEYAGSGLPLGAAAAILEEQKRRFLPEIASGKLRLQAFGVSEPGAGSDTTRIRTTAERVDGGYVVRGQKIWTSRALHSDLMLLLARTTPVDQVARKTEGLSTFVVDMRSALEAGTMTIAPSRR